MLNGNYTSVYEIIERVFDTFDSEAIEFFTMVRHISDALLLIGINSQLNRKVEKIDIISYRGTLPSDLVYINQVRTCDTHKALRYSGNTFHHALNPDSPDKFIESDLTYTLNNSYIFTNFETGTIEISYDALPVDSKGFPLIPDDIKYKMAMEYYLMERIAFKLYLQDRISERKYERILQEKSWYMGAAQSRGRMPSVDQMESIKNAVSRMLIMPMAHSTFFTSISGAENMKIQPY